MTVTVDLGTVDLTCLQVEHEEGALTGVTACFGYTVVHDLNDADPERKAETGEVDVFEVLTTGEKEHLENMLDNVLAHLKVKAGT